MLSNLETADGKLVQIVFSGQPELETKLKDHSLRQLDQRISIRRYIAPLSEEETYKYLEHRLKIVGGYLDLFSKESLKFVWEYSGGVPRKVNMLCDNAFLTGFGLDKKQITPEILGEANMDINQSPFEPSRKFPEKSSSPGIFIPSIESTENHNQPEYESEKNEEEFGENNLSTNETKPSFKFATAA